MTQTTSELPVRSKQLGGQGSATNGSAIALGKPALEQFLFDPSYRNLNHGMPPASMVTGTYSVAYLGKAPSGQSHGSSRAR